MAGLGYAGSAIAVRGVTWPLDVPVVAAALAVPVYGLLAFWLYSLALNKSAVANSSAPLVVGQTLVPAIVGIWLLGDSVREGWVAAVVLGMTLRGGRRRAAQSDDRRSGACVSPGSRTMTPSTISSIFFITSSSRRTPAALTFSVTCSGRLAPMIADDTLGFCSTHATAS